MRFVSLTVLTATLRNLLLAAILCVSAGARLQAVEDEPVQPDPALLEFRERFEATVADSLPESEFAFPEANGGATLVMRSKTREYQVYPSDMTGRLGRELRPVEGPDDGGLMLTVRVQEAGEINQAVVPQTLQRPYWFTWLNVIPAPGGEKQFFVALSYRRTTDEELVTQIREMLAEFGRRK